MVEEANFRMEFIWVIAIVAAWLILSRFTGG
jgi:hypothetical protein